MCEGFADELPGIDGGDQRLNKRSVRVIEALAANPEATYLNRICPKLPCTAVFAESEWKSVWRVVKKKPPLLSKFMQLLLQLGGYNHRAKELPAGPQPLWVGLRRMTDFATTWLAFGPKTG